jgi:hypothetical protein
MISEIFTLEQENSGLKNEQNQNEVMNLLAAAASDSIQGDDPELERLQWHGC